MTVTAEGVDQLAGTLGDAGVVIADLSDVHRDAGRRVLGLAVIPRATGHLADGADVVATDDGFTLTAAATYAGYVHARDPFFKVAIHRATDAIGDSIVDHATDALSDIRGA